MAPGLLLDGPNGINGVNGIDHDADTRSVTDNKESSQRRLDPYSVVHFSSKIKPKKYNMAGMSCAATVIYHVSYI